MGQNHHKDRARDASFCLWEALGRDIMDNLQRIAELGYQGQFSTGRHIGCFSAVNVEVLEGKIRAASLILLLPHLAYAGARMIYIASRLFTICYQ